MEPIYLVVGVLAMSATALIFCLNRLAALEARYRQAFGDVDVYLQRRHDMIPNLIATAKGFAAHETSLLTTLNEALVRAQGAGDVEQRLQKEGAVSDAVRAVLVNSAQSHQLSSSVHFQQLMDELRDTEDKLSAARRFLNLAAAEHNAALSQFPFNLIARLKGARPCPVFDTGMMRPLLEIPTTVKI